MRPVVAVKTSVVSLSICCSLMSLAAQGAEDSLAKDYRNELPRIAPTEPHDALSTLEVAPGFRVQLVAAEPLVSDPVAIDFDPHGDAYVVEMRGYSEQAAEQLGRVRRLRDTDGDGTLDQAVTFLDGLSWPTAVAWYNGGVLIGVAPDILYCRDRDGDGTADEIRQVFSGFGRKNVQGMLNSFRWGLDGRFYAAVSSNGGTITGASIPADAPLLLRGRDLAWDPRTDLAEAVTGGGQHGASFDRWGNRYVCSNSNHLQQIRLQDRYLARNSLLVAPRAVENVAVDGPAAAVYRASPVEPWRVVRTRLRVQGIVGGPVEGGGRAAGYFTSATGITVYQGDAYPTNLLDNVLIGDVGGNLVHRKRMERPGLEHRGQRVEQASEFLRSTDIWFRPVQLANSPDGVLYVLDMYREVIEHPLSLHPVIKRHLDLTSGQDRGRIFRIVPAGFEPQRRPLPGDVTGERLVDMLVHSNGWHRQMAARMLHAGPDRALVAYLRKLLRVAHLAEGRLQVLATLGSWEEANADDLLHALDDPDPYVRARAVRIAEDRALAPDRLANRLLALANDGDPIVRYQLACSLGEWERSPGWIDAFTELAHRDASDPIIRTALLSSLAEARSDGLAHLLADTEFLRQPDGMALLLEIIGQIGRGFEPQEVQPTVRLLVDLSERNRQLAERLMRQFLLSAGKHRDALQKQFALATGLTQARLLTDLHASAAATALATDQKMSLRVEAIRALRLVDFPVARPTLSRLLDYRQPPRLQSAALQAASGQRDDQVASLLVAAWPRISPALQNEVVQILSSRRAWVDYLLKEWERGAIDSALLTPPRLQPLLRHKDRAVRQKAEALLGQSDKRTREEVVARYQVVLQTAGDVDRGRGLFRQHCAACHRLEGHGVDLGPSLAGIHYRGAAAILIAVLDPNRERNPQYEVFSATTVDGRTLSGIITAESAASLTLRRAGGEQSRLLRTELDELWGQGHSLMPEGFERELDPLAMADLIAYLLAMGESATPHDITGR